MFPGMPGLALARVFCFSLCLLGLCRWNGVQLGLFLLCAPPAFYLSCLVVLHHLYGVPRPFLSPMLGTESSFSDSATSRSPRQVALNLPSFPETFACYLLS